MKRLGSFFDEIYGFDGMSSFLLFISVILNLARPLCENIIEKREEQAEAKLFRFFKCPVCKQKLRVPKGKGKVEITCPKCGNKFIKKA